MFCTKCGKQVNENSKFCQNCGALITDKINLESKNKIHSNEKIVINSENVIYNLKNKIKKLSFGFILAYCIEALSLIITFFFPIVAEYRLLSYSHRSDEIKVSHQLRIFGSSWAYVDNNYNLRTEPEEGQVYARLYAVLFIAIAVFCFIWAIMKEKKISSHIIMMLSYIAFSRLTLSLAGEYFDSTEFEFTGIYYLAAFLLFLSLILILIYKNNLNKTISDYIQHILDKIKLIIGNDA